MITIKSRVRLFIIYKMDLQIPYQQSTQNKGLFNQFDVKILVQQSIVKAEKRMKGQFLEPQNHQSNPNESQIKMQTFKYTFDNISKTIYFLDHQLISSDQNAVEKSLLQLNNLFQFLFENPNHKIKNGEIINTQAGQNQIHRKVSIQSLNPLIARMLDMFLNSKIFVFKNYIADIMIRYAFVIKQIFIKEQLLQVLNKGIKGFDEYTRIISAKIIPSFIEMFEKDLVGFEYIIHKIQSFDKTNNFNVSYLVQKHSFVDCLKQMLQKSQVLSSFFIKNIKEQAFMINFHPEQKCLNINQMSILRFYEFCLHVKINTSDSLDLFKNLLKIYKNRSKNIQIMDIELLKKLKLHISKLFVKMFNQNFKVLKAIYDFQLQDSIQIDITLIQMKFGDFDEHQQKYILKDCPQKLRQLLTFQNQIIKQKSENLLQKFFMKFYTKVNQFDIQLDHHHQNIEIRKNLILKQRRLEEFLELCESQKHQKIVSLIKIWLNINGLMLSLLNNIKKQDLQVKFESTKFSIQKTASQFQDLQEELFITAEVFLLLQKSYKSNNGQFFFKQSLWANSQKLPVQNKNFLKWTYLSQKTLQNLYL